MRLKVKTPLSYFLLIGFFCLVAFFILLLTNLMGLIDIEDVFFFLSTAIIGWISLILLALIGAIFVGMFLSHRILTIGGFTPFEEEMLRMREDIKTINEKLDELMDQENKEGETD